MLPTNTMQYGTDGFNFRRQALLRTAAPMDFTYETSVTGFEISGTEPEGTSRRVVFEIDGQLYRFGNSGLDVYDDRGEFEDIINEGNTVGELLSLSDIPEFVGKKVYPVIALDAPFDAPVMPRIKISAKVNSYNDIYTKTEYSPVYNLKRTGDACKIARIAVSKTTNGNGTATVKCRLNHPIRGWSDWIFVEEAANELATAVQFQVQYILSTLDGSDFARINSAVVFYTTDSDRLSGDFEEIVTAPVEYFEDLGTCYALLKHGELIDCDLKAYVNFSQSVKRRERISLGNATGAQQTIVLMFNGVVEKNVAQDTIHLEIGGRTFSDFYFDTQNSTLTFTAENGAAIFASYECGLNDDEWREMEHDFTRTTDGISSSRFVFRLSDSAGKRVSAVKFRLSKKNSTATATLGTGTGRQQTFALDHRAIAETLTCTGSWIYDEDTQILKIVAPIGSPITVNYEWRGQFPAVHEYIIGWTPKI